mgnify:CR=1 FL=1|jgi:hypothetical protein|tara:strand:+ start:37 stop:504 length:468 start_codon:yes stop_codon:yes gene_type:complete
MSNKAMRVCDREVIERKVVDTWKQKSLHDFEKLVKSSKVDKALDNLIKDFNSVVSKINDLETERNKLRDSIELMAKQFNEEHTSFEDSNRYHRSYAGTYIRTDISYGTSKARYSLETHVPHEIRQGIQDELALQTMCGDFDANELIQSLVNTFVK